MPSFPCCSSPCTSLCSRVKFREKWHGKRQWPFNFMLVECLFCLMITGWCKRATTTEWTLPHLPPPCLHYPDQILPPWASTPTRGHPSLEAHPTQEEEGATHRWAKMWVTRQILVGSRLSDTQAASAQPIRTAQKIFGSKAQRAATMFGPHSDRAKDLWILDKTFKIIMMQDIWSLSITQKTGGF